MSVAARIDSGDAGAVAAADGSFTAEARHQTKWNRSAKAWSTETGGAQMNWESFYLICFLVGLALSAVSLLGGMGHFGGQVHLPHATHVPHLPHGAGSHPSAIGARGGANVPWWNAFSLMIFLCW